MGHLTRLLASSIPGATTRRIEGAGHAAPFDATDGFVQLVAGVIASFALETDDVRVERAPASLPL
jgi:pimeloyl-ACP methyl ester carboxylesterase